jgi:hypothetical protein
MTMNATLLLDNTNWDLLADAAGNIAVARPPYALAQDVASAIKLFAGELWYDATKGVPYFEEILGQSPPLGLFQAYMVKAALTVPGVVAAQCNISSVDGRTVTGQVIFTDESGNQQTVAIGS